MGIPRQGIKTASSGLPDIQTDRILPFMKITILGNPQPSPNHLIFAQIFGEWREQFVRGGFMSRNGAAAVKNPKKKGYHNEESL